MVATHFPSQNLWPLLWKQLFFIFSLYRFSSAQDNSTTCDVPWVEPLADTFITCHLPTNVNQPNAFFGVSFESDKEKKSQDILDCGWHPGKMVCFINRPGYKYDNTTHVSNKFSLEILQASAEHIGTYKCFLVNIHSKNVKPCEFRVKVVGKTMCVISSLESKTRTLLTCYYPEDLNKTRTNFTVYHYSRTGSTEIILACEWKGDNLTCNTTHGYEFDDRVSDYLTLKIPMALESQEGAYSCHISGARSLHYDPCTVTPEKSDAVNSTCQIPSVEEAEPTALTCKFSVDVNRTKRNFTVVHRMDPDRKAVAIINCTWIGDHLTCATALGYQFNNTVTDDVIIQVPQSSHNHSGMYACNVMGTVSRSFEPCEFIIRPVSDQFFLHYLLIAVDVFLMCIPLSLIIVIIVMRMKNTSHINKRNVLPNKEHMSVQSSAPYPVSEDIDNVDESTPMIRMEHGGRDHETCESSVDEDMVRNPTEIVDTNQKASQEQDIGGHSSIQSEVDEGRNHQTFPQSGSRDTQPSSNGDITGNNNTQDGRHSPVQSDAHEEVGNQTSLQSGTVDPQPPAKGDRKTSRGKRMSVTSEKKKKRRRKKDITTDECSLPITDIQAVLLATKGSLSEGLEKTGADVQFDIDQKPINGMYKVVIRGSPAQIHAAVTLIMQKQENKEIISEQFHKAWLQWVEAAFPNFHSRAYFLPPVYFNRVPMSRHSIADQDVLTIQSTPGQAAAAAAADVAQTIRVQESDIREDAAMQRVLFCLQEMFKLSKEGLFGISQLSFEDYLGGDRYPAKAAQIPLPDDLPTCKMGCFDILVIHQHYGIIVCEVKSLGLNLSSNEIDNQIKKRLQQCVSQLDNAEEMLSHLVSDIAPGLRITKTIAFPNLTAHQVQQAILNDDKLNQDLSTCLRTTDCNNVAGLFLTSDQLSDPRTPWDVSSDVMKKIENWWQHRVTADGHDSHMSGDIYKKLMTRFCGPATNVTVQYSSSSRHCVKTLGQAVSLTGERYTAVITLFPEQVELLSQTSSRLFVAGPPGTGKTVVLQLKGVEWLRFGDVYIVSTWVSSRAACTLLHDQLLKHTSSDSTVTLKQYDFKSGTDVENAVKELSEVTKRKRLMVIADEVGPDGSGFKTFCEQLVDKVPDLHLWAASCYHGYSPQRWPVKYLTKSLRCPPAVVREVKQASEIERGNVLGYSERGVPDHTDGPPVKRLYHRGQGHSGDWPVDCGKCGEEVASFLHSLHVGVVQTTSNTTAIASSGSAAPHALRWSDVLVLYHDAVSDNAGVVTALRTAGIPVQVKRRMKDDDIKDLVLARRDVVWVLGGYHVHGLERKVVVCLDPEASSENPTMDVGFRLHYMSRCTSQLVIVSSGDKLDIRVMKKLENWWQHRVTADGHDSDISSDIYKKRMTRFCGPATNVTVQYTSNSRHCVKTLGQAVSLTGDRNTAVITLFPEQVKLLNKKYSRLFVAGPPGTGKTVVLQLKGVEWLRFGDVYIVSTWVSSRAACTLLHENLLPHTSSDSTVILKQYNFKSGTDVENAVKELSEGTKLKRLMVIADEVGPDGSSFKTFCEQLVDKFPHLHLWAASCYHGYSPQGWPVEYLTKSLRCPPAVVREVKQASEIEKGNVRGYSERGVADHTDGPPVTRLYHRGQGHSGDWPVDCGKCGEEVASFLHSLHDGVVQTTSNTTAISSSGSAAPHALRWSDVLVLYHDAVSDNAGVVTALRSSGIPVKVKRRMKDDDIMDLVSPHRDVVWVLGGYHVHGLERKVVVCLDPEASADNPTMDVGFRLHYMSRCTSQLVIVSSVD